MTFAGFSEPFIRRPVGTTLLALGLLLVGIVAYRFLPVASMPSVDYPTIRVSASRPGADPEIMAATVAAPLERRLGEIAGVTELTSRSSLGSTRISVQFDLNRNIDSAARDVQAAINAALTDLPSDLPSRPSFRKSNPAATPIMILALTSQTVPASALYDAADTVIVQRLSQIEGVAEVSVNGAEQPAIRIRVDPIALASMGLSMEDVRIAIADSNALGPIGAFDGNERAITIATNDQLRAAPDYDHIVVRSANGTVVQLAAVASIEAGVRNSRSAGWFNGQPSVLLVITKQTDANVIETVDRIYELLPELERWIPAGIEITVLSDRTKTIRASVLRHAAHAARDHRPGDAGGVRVPAAGRRHHRRRRHGPAVARRHLRDDVGRRLLHRQSVADGARGLGRLRGRRRHRHDRELLPQPREGHVAVARRHRRRAADRVHGDGDQHLAGRRLHPAPVHERGGRPHIPGILADARLRHRGVDRGVAHPDPDDLRAFRAHPAVAGPHLARPRGRARARPHGSLLCAQPCRGAQPSRAHAAGHGRHARGERDALCPDAERIFSAGRYRAHLGRHASLDRGVVPGHVRLAAEGRSHRACRSCDRQCRLLDRQLGLQRLGQSRVAVHQPQAALRAGRAQRAGGGQSPAAERCQYCGAARLLLSDAGRPGRRPLQRFHLSIHALGCRLSGASAVGAAGARQDRSHCRAWSMSPTTASRAGCR